jgi:hypothetical protein
MGYAGQKQLREMHMSYEALKKKEVLRIVLFMVFFLFTVAINLSCSEDNPVKGPECGSGQNTWDTKSQVCRDAANNHIVPNSCCGQ